jgi:hypothetical protein
MSMPSIPTIADVEQICAQEDPVIRNLQITQCYHDLALAERSGWNANMFRCYETTPELFEAPFTEEQTAALKEGRLPTGRL